MLEGLSGYQIVFNFVFSVPIKIVGALISMELHSECYEASPKLEFLFSFVEVPPNFKLF